MAVLGLSGSELVSESGWVRASPQHPMVVPIVLDCMHVACVGARVVVRPPGRPYNRACMRAVPCVPCRACRARCSFVRACVRSYRLALMDPILTLHFNARFKHSSEESSDFFLACEPLVRPCSVAAGSAPVPAELLQCSWPAERLAAGRTFRGAVQPQHAYVGVLKAASAPCFRLLRFCDAAGHLAARGFEAIPTHIERPGMADLHGTGLGVYFGSAWVRQRNERLHFIAVSSFASPSFDHGEGMAETATATDGPSTD